MVAFLVMSSPPSVLTRPVDLQAKRGHENSMVPNGNGVVRTPDGQTFSGTFLDGLPHGRYAFCWKDICLSKKACIDSIQKHRCTWSDKKANQYVGEWQLGKKHGQGAMEYGSGDMYVGAYNLGRQVVGSLQLAQGTYSGKFEGDETKEKAQSTVPRTGAAGAREKLDARVKDSANHSSFTWNDETHYEVYGILFLYLLQHFHVSAIRKKIASCHNPDFWLWVALITEQTIVGPGRMGQGLEAR